jgi:hypothetical protein
VVTEDGVELTLFARLRHHRRTRIFRARLWADGAADGPLLDFAAKRLATVWLIVVSNIPARRALAAYRKRWAIECMFGDAKTRGLNREDTRLTDPRKPALLMALVALAIAWAGTRGRRPDRPGLPRAQVARPLRPVLVPRRLRPDPEPPRIGSWRRNRAMAKAPKTPANQRSRVVWTFG